MTNTDWFTENAFPMPNLRAWFQHSDGTVGSDETVLLLVQREYPLDHANRRDTTGSWIDSRTVFASAGPAGEVMPVEDVNNFIGLFPTDLPAEVVQRLVAKAAA